MHLIKVVLNLYEIAVDTTNLKNDTVIEYLNAYMQKCITLQLCLLHKVYVYCKFNFQKVLQDAH